MCEHQATAQPTPVSASVPGGANTGDIPTPPHLAGSACGPARVHSSPDADSTIGAGVECPSPSKGAQLALSDPPLSDVGSSGHPMMSEEGEGGIGLSVSASETPTVGIHPPPAASPSSGRPSSPSHPPTVPIATSSPPAAGIEHCATFPTECCEAGCSVVLRSYDEKVRHERTHSGERPFKCTACGKAFKRTSCLKRHAATHLKVPPFACGKCSQRFSFKWAAQRHEILDHVQDDHVQDEAGPAPLPPVSQQYHHGRPNPVPQQQFCRAPRAAGTMLCAPQWAVRQPRATPYGHAMFRGSFSSGPATFGVAGPSKSQPVFARLMPGKTCHRSGKSVRAQHNPVIIGDLTFLPQYFTCGCLCNRKLTLTSYVLAANETNGGTDVYSKDCLPVATG